MVHRCALLLCFLALAAPVQAATLTEVPPLELRGASRCVTTTDAPGEVAVASPDGMRFVHASRSGLVAGEALTIGKYFDCWGVALRPSGAGVIIGELPGNRLVAVIRDPGGTWSAPITISEDDSDRDGVWLPAAADAAVSDRGDVVVAYKEKNYSSFDALDRLTAENVPARFRVVRRAPGGAFGAPEQVGPVSRRAGTILAGIGAAGEAIAAFTTVNGAPPYRVPVTAAIAPPGGAFGTPVHVADSRWLTPPVLQMAPDGRAIVATLDATSVQVAERVPEGAFAAAQRVAGAPAGLTALSAALGADGATAMAWTEARTGRAQAVTRPAGGAFTAPATLANGSRPDPGDDPFYTSETYFRSLIGSLLAALRFDPGPVPVALTPDARAALAVNAQLATGPLAGGPFALAGAPPAAAGARPIVLADGAPALVWTEVLDGDTMYDDNARYRLRLAADNVAVAAPADPPAPRVTVGRPRSRTLDPGERLRLPVSCSAACDVRVALVDSPYPIEAFLHLNGRGGAELEFEEVASFAPARVGPLRLRITYGAHGALRPKSRIETIRVARSARVPVPRVRGLRAERRGNRVIVSFRATGVEEDFPLFVSGDDARRFNGEPLVTRGVNPREGQREYRIVLPARPGLKWVTVRGSFDYGPGSTTRTRVR